MTGLLTCKLDGRAEITIALLRYGLGISAEAGSFSRGALH
jgi:hypothetical protein